MSSQLEKHCFRKMYLKFCVLTENMYVRISITIRITRLNISFYSHNLKMMLLAMQTIEKMSWLKNNHHGTPFHQVSMVHWESSSNAFFDSPIYLHMYVYIIYKLQSHLLCTWSGRYQMLKTQENTLQLSRKYSTLEIHLING